MVINPVWGSSIGLLSCYNLHAGSFFKLLLLSAYFSKLTFSKNLSWKLLECQKVLVWFQTVYKGYDEMTKATANKKRVNNFEENCMYHKSVWGESQVKKNMQLINNLFSSYFH